MLQYLQSKDQFDAKAETAAKVVERLRPYVRFVAEFVADGGKERAVSFRSRSGAAGVDTNAELLEIALCEHGKLDYSPKEIVDLINERDHEGTLEARSKIARYSSMLFVTVKRNLEALYQEHDDAWWFQGVPAEVQSYCQQAITRDKGKSDRWDHVGLEEVIEIVEKSGNWRSFKHLMNARTNRGNRKEDVLRDIRNIVPIRDLLKDGDTTLSKTQVAMIDDFADLVVEMASELGFNDNLAEAALDSTGRYEHEHVATMV